MNKVLGSAMAATGAVVVVAVWILGLYYTLDYIVSRFGNFGMVAIFAMFFWLFFFTMAYEDSAKKRNK